MKILLTGGGTGGHFYPLIAVAVELKKLAEIEKIPGLDLYFMSDDPYEERTLFENGIKFIKISAGKRRRYFSLKNIPDFFRTVFGSISTFFKMYSIFPDVIFSKGGYASFPPLLAARILRIPVVIHESDSHPGRVGIWSGKFARKVALSYPEATEFFPKEKVAVTGNPIRKQLLSPIRSGARDYLRLEENIPVIYISGGSQGSQIINDSIVDILSELVSKYQIIHQAGKANIENVTKRAGVVLSGNQNRSRYKVFDLLDEQSLRMIAGVTELIISRAGSSIFEIAAWEIPSIIIPITDSQGDHQRQNAYSYARSGAAEVLEESNLTPHILIAEIDRIMQDENLRGRMAEGAKKFSRQDAANKIAREIINIGLEHEK